jgi:predicted nucleotidyltransferase
VVVFGSWGRGELTRGSDHDWAILVNTGEADQRPDIKRLDSAVRRPDLASVTRTHLIF